MENNSHHQNMSSGGSGIDNRIEIQVGYRFRPTDHELITKYLMKKFKNQLSKPCDNIDIRDEKLYDHSPWDLTKTYAEDENWYFFNSRKRKYPKGHRPDRAAGEGYWKPTGVDKSIKEEDGTKEIGYKKSLDFYLGKHPHGIKTDWKMHEYRLAIKVPPHQDSMMLDEWVLSRIYKKRDSNKNRLISNDHDDEAAPVSDGSLGHSSPEAAGIQGLNLEGEPPQQQPSSDILLEAPNNPSGYLSDALIPCTWICDYGDHNNQMMKLSTHEVLQPNISIFDDYYHNAANLFGGDGFLEDVVYRPWKNTVPDDEHAHEEHGVECLNSFDLVGHSQGETAI